MIRLLPFFVLVASLGCEQPPPPTFCEAMAQRCSPTHADAWTRWCESDCVPDYARTHPCDENDACVLCDAPRTDGQTIYFGLPGDEIEYLWTQLDDVGEPTHPSSEPTPTGDAFHDGRGDFDGDSTRYGQWQPIQPYDDVMLGAPGGFCEPGPNLFVRDNVSTDSDGALVLRAERMPEEFFDMYCDYPNCPWGPYADCGGPALGMCPYGDAPEMAGVGSASQADRTGGDPSAPPTYGYGHFRGVLRASDGADAVPTAGFVYAFFSQSNEYCDGATPNLDTNTSELDVELSSGPGLANDQPFCDESQMCFQVSTWVSSTQGIGNGAQGIQRHQVSGFRFHDMATAGQYRTYGWDWQEDEVRFTYDSNPDDCDEHAGTCTSANASIAVCRHLRFVPRRPSPMHLQLWNARWAGRPMPGTRAAMSVRDVWHEPSP